MGNGISIYISGALAFDRIMLFPGRFSDHILPDKIHRLSVRFPISKLQVTRGGPAGNIAHGLALLDERPLILSCAGNDFESYKEHLTALHLPLHGITVLPDQLTAGAYITTDKDNNQITCFHAGACDYPAAHNLIAEENEEALLIVSPGNMLDMLTLPDICRQKGLNFIADPGQAITSMSSAQLISMLEGAMLLICNDYELQLIMTLTGFKEEALLDLCRNLIITLGAQGCRLTSRTGQKHIRAAAADDIDPTGAGDAFRAGLLKGLAYGNDLESCAMLGSVMAAFCVEHYGPQEYFFAQQEFWERAYAEFALTPALCRIGS